ncbi:MULTISPECIES: tail fiber assembly protein [Pseudomonas]|uniref:tail fiber assembly protein n=1 Tax=Pseudomonas TaxID=286 RepID=UPI001B334A0F|nr:MULTISPECIES: tail fiber assembly protein [Pseudomonas]MBP5945074.1 tail fiber assembly protein [Pseudomonas sp. P9(2020)]MBP5957249.1 tail fiber assembly protein [Pseudomonas anatoliensis]MBZ9561663.1 tail fiber assembly protein [Pseudomonas sp. P116]
MFNYLIDDSGALTGPVEFPLVPGIGVQLPSNAVTLSIELSPAPSGYAWAYDNGSLQQKLDLRGDVYRTNTGIREVWTALGDIPEGFTKLPWPGGFHAWVDNAWQIDQAAQLADLKRVVLVKRDTLLREAVLRIAPLQYAEDIGDASHDEQLLLLEWKLYSVELNRIEKQPGFPQEVSWPVIPGASVVN